MRDLGVQRLAFESDERPAWRQRPRQPCGAVSGQSADLQNAPGARDLCDQAQELALVYGDLNRWEPGGCGVLDIPPQAAVFRREKSGNVPVDPLDQFLVQGLYHSGITFSRRNSSSSSAE